MNSFKANVRYMETDLNDIVTSQEVEQDLKASTLGELSNKIITDQLLSVDPKVLMQALSSEEVTIPLPNNYKLPNARIIRTIEHENKKLILDIQLTLLSFDWKIVD